MAGPGTDPTVIIQTQTPSGYLSEGYSGVPVLNLSRIVIATNGTARSLGWANELRQSLGAAVLGSTPDVRLVSQQSLSGTGAPAGVPGSRNLLILIGDGAVPFDQRTVPSHWVQAVLVNNAQNFAIMPVLPQGVSVTTNLPANLRRLNVKFWSRSISATIPDVLAVVGLTSDESRIFISYRRIDTSELAEQLFEALAKAKFDVFLDRFTVPPAVDFQARLTSELADKSMVLLLESKNIVDSPWTMYEINFAKKHKLGLLALQPPGGINLAGIDPAARRVLAPSDFRNQRTCKVLRNASLEEVVQRVKDEHGWALLRRRQLIRDAMCEALLRKGVRNYALGPDGLIRVPPEKSARRPKGYSIWLTTRPPELPDFHATSVRSVSPSNGVIIGPAQSMEAARTARIDWLSLRCTIPYFDEGKILDVADAIAKGQL